jgi:hypothetical protein
MPASRGEPRTGHPETLKGILHFSLRLHLKAARSLKLIEGFLGSRYALPRDTAMTINRKCQDFGRLVQRPHLSSDKPSYAILILVKLGVSLCFGVEA